VSALSGDLLGEVPATCVTQVGTVEAVGAVSASWSEALDPEKMARLGTSLYKLTGLETTRIPFCLTVQAEALGCKVELGKIDRTSAVVGAPL